MAGKKMPPTKSQSTRNGADAAEIAVECGLAWDDAKQIVDRHKEYQSRSVINLAAERSRRKLANGTL